MEISLSTIEDARDILTRLDKIPNAYHIVIELLNKKSHQEMHDLSIRDRTKLVIESNKVITNKPLAQNILDLES